MGNLCDKQQKIERILPDGLEFYNEDIKNREADTNEKMYQAVENAFFLKEIPLYKYMEILVKFDSPNIDKQTLSNNIYNINHLNIYYSKLDIDKKFEKLLEQLIETVNFKNNEEKKRSIEIFTEIYNLMYLNSKSEDPNGFYRIYFVALGLLFCPASNIQKLEFFFNFFRMCDYFIVDLSRLKHITHYLYYISTYILSSLVCKALKFDFDEICKGNTVDNNEENRRKKEYISLFCDQRPLGKLESINPGLIIGYKFDELTNELVNSINFDHINLTWDQFLSKYTARENEEVKFWPFSPCLIRNFIRENYKNNYL